MVHTIKRKRNVIQVYSHEFHKRLCELGVWDKFLRAVRKVNPIGDKNLTIDFTDRDDHSEVLKSSFTFDLSKERHDFWWDISVRLGEEK